MEKQIKINEEILWDYVDGLLSEADQKAVHSTLSTTNQWNEFLEKVQAEKALLSAIPTTKPSPSFSSKVMKEWNVEQVVLQKKQRAKSNLLRWIFTFMGALLLASLCLFLYAAIQSLGNLIQVSFAVENLITDPTYWYSLLMFSLISLSVMMEKWASFKNSSWSRA